MLNSLRSKKRNGRGRKAGAWLLPMWRWWPQSQQPPVLDLVSQSLNCFLQIKKTKHNSRLCSWQFLLPTSSPTQNTFLLPGLPGRGAASFHPTCRKQTLLEVLLFSSEISIPTDNMHSRMLSWNVILHLLTPGQQKRPSMHKLTRYFCSSDGYPHPGTQGLSSVQAEGLGRASAISGWATFAARTLQEGISPSATC